MQHLRIATYGINKGTFQEVADTARTGMLPKFREQPGFVRYGLADLGDKTCMSISVWETREQFDQFAQAEIGPYSQQVGIPAPPETTYREVHNYLERAQ